MATAASTLATLLNPGQEHPEYRWHQPPSINDQEVEMLRKGMKIERLTKRVGQVAATGRVVELRDQGRVEIKWDDGHTSVTSRGGVVPLTEANDPHRDD